MLSDNIEEMAITMNKTESQLFPIYLHGEPHFVRKTKIMAVLASDKSFYEFLQWFLADKQGSSRFESTILTLQ